MVCTTGPIQYLLRRAKYGKKVSQLIAITCLPFLLMSLYSDFQVEDKAQKDERTGLCNVFQIKVHNINGRRRWTSKKKRKVPIQQF